MLGGYAACGLKTIRGWHMNRKRRAFEVRDASDAVLYEVQVGAFLEIEQAQEMMEQLQGTYSAVYIATRDGPFGSYHRVRIGPFQARREAHEVAQALVQEGYYVFLD